MTDTDLPPPPRSHEELRTLAIVIYALSLAGFLTGGLTSLAALIIGLVKRPEAAGTPYESHFEFANWTNVWGLVGCVVIAIAGLLLMIVLIGFVVWFVGFPLLAIWYLVRNVVGLIRLMDNQPIAAPRGWFI